MPLTTLHTHTHTHRACISITVRFFLTNQSVNHNSASNVYTCMYTTESPPPHMFCRSPHCNVANLPTAFYSKTQPLRACLFHHAAVQWNVSCLLTRGISSRCRPAVSNNHTPFHSAQTKRPVLSHIHTVCLQRMRACMDED